MFYSRTAKIVPERLKKDIIKLVIDGVVIDGEKLKISAVIPSPNKIEERKIVKNDFPDTFNGGATLGEVNQTNMQRIWNKHKEINTILKPRSRTCSSLRGKPKVLVAMSGGVDSSVAAALLVKQGYFVTGAYMKNFSPESWQGVVEKKCPWKQDLEDVKSVCQKLGIEFRSFNFEKEYRKKVIDYFFTEYKTGRTPNPDIRCNKEIKFGLFLEKALKLGFDYVATGHYARVRPLPSLPRPGEGGRRPGEVESFKLLKGIDPNKDQSYFLYTLTQNQLRHILFPVGDYRKEEVRKIAKKIGLHNWNKKDSQGVCFVGHIKLREFLRQRIPERIGEIVNVSGKIVGYHRGAWYYTIGQRHGLGIGGGIPYYVVKKDIPHNKLIVAQGRYDRLVYRFTLKIRSVHWISGIPNFPLRCGAKIRYQQLEQGCEIKKTTKGYLVKFKKPQFAIAPGQSIVFYQKDVVLGGGIID